jgi:hypothetical protein
MKGEQDGVCMKLKKKCNVPVPSDAESDIEIVEMPITPMTVGKGKRQCEGSPWDIDIDAPIPVRCWLNLNDFDGCHSSSMSPTPPSAPQTTLSSHVHHQPDLDDFDAHHASSMSPTPLSAPQTTLSPRLASGTKASHTTEPSIIEVFVPVYDSTKWVWPQGMYTTDMVTGF